MQNDSDAGGFTSKRAFHAPRSNSPSGMGNYAQNNNPRSWLSISVNGERNLHARQRSRSPSTMLTHSNRDRWRCLIRCGCAIQWNWLLTVVEDQRRKQSTASQFRLYLGPELVKAA